MSLVFKHIHSPTSWSLLNGTSAHFDKFYYITLMMLKLMPSTLHCENYRLLSPAI